METKKFIGLSPTGSWIVCKGQGTAYRTNGWPFCTPKQFDYFSESCPNPTGCPHGWNPLSMATALPGPKSTSVHALSKTNMQNNLACGGALCGSEGVVHQLSTKRLALLDLAA
eukprot:1149766-Pelagomonas_calceolata.AAC.8